MKTSTGLECSSTSTKSEAVSESFPAVSRAELERKGYEVRVNG